MRNLVYIAILIIVACCSGPTDISNGAANLKEHPVDTLLAKMTIDEKIGQLTLYTSGWDVTGPKLNDNYLNELKDGRVGALFNAHTVGYARELQRIAVEETRLGIPLIFGYDVIHGYKTIYPIPLAEACTWDMALIEETARLSAKEAAAAGLNWTFNPMVDIARDPRWGRIAEGSGEDVYLGSQIAVAKVKGYQGDDLSSHETVMACVKHFAAYGAPQAGRDYHTVDMSDRVLREIYLPPYKAAIEAGAATVMTAFNEVDGVPATGSSYLLTDILRKEWGFDGFVVTDYTSINEMVPHGVVANEKEAAELALEAGVDMDMQGGVYNQHLKALLEEGKITEDLINRSVKRILVAKWDLGLFKDPYRYFDAEREKNVVLSEEMINHSYKAAKESIVLLKNEGSLLPLDKNVRKIALIGPLVDNQVDLLGTWHASGDASKAVKLIDAVKAEFPGAHISYAKGADFSGDDKSGFSEAKRLAEQADIVIMALGENHQQSGEAASRTDINLPGVQKDLLKEIHKTGKPVVAIIMAGRPLTIEWADENIPAIVYAWHLGTMASPAIADVLSGDENPSGKLTITFPRNVGQIPIYYSMKNTGRPFRAEEKYTSKYIDSPNEPLYPFGYGLSYSKFEYSNLKLDKNSFGEGEKINLSVDVTNNSEIEGEEVVQLYIRDLVGSVTRPVKELKDFQKVNIGAGEKKTINFNIDVEDLEFYTRNMEYKVEPGDFVVYVGPNSIEGLEKEFSFVKK